jgi:3-oxoacyl-[acyl-carrier protein] reductase
MDLGIKGRVALVQGASAGLGRAIAKALVEEGARVAICSRDADKITKAREELGAELALPCDLGQPGAALALSREVEAKLGSCDILVHNTGGPPKLPFADVSTAQWHDGFDGLWMSAIDSIQGVLPGMKARGWGRILTVVSSGVVQPLPVLGISNSLRSALVPWSKTLSAEVARAGITANILVPGRIDTERVRLTDEASAGREGLSADAVRERSTGSIPMGRYGDPDEFGALAAFVASVPAAYITGAMLRCDGGNIRAI